MRGILRSGKASVVCLCALLLAACASGGAPVLDLYTIYQHHRPSTQPVTRGQYRVKPGDTLYSIAYRYGWSLTRLAAANQIRSPYTIYPGEVIRFDRQQAKSSSASTHRSPSAHSSPARQAKAQRHHSALPAGSIHWRWPAEGKLLSRYGSSDSPKGITIGGKRGSSVRAAAAGIVVYRGKGVAGYGNLLIIKHNKHWLSAYAHNRQLLVKEGRRVTAGQKIATLGDTGTRHTQLYFEIRRDGKPVDPTRLLPKR